MKTSQQQRDHGGGLDAAVAAFGGQRSDWLDLSTGINPTAYPLPEFSDQDWTALPDVGAMNTLIRSARDFWNVPPELGILPVPGASAAIAHIPRLTDSGTVWIPSPTYNEHAASFAAEGWQVSQHAADATACVLVNPNNPDGRRWDADHLCGSLRVIDESFCEVTPDATLLGQAQQPGTLVLKSFGKFWGLAGVRLGFVIGDLVLIHRLAQMLGPWAVAGPALRIGAAALADQEWANDMRARLISEATRLDALMAGKGAELIGGTSLFRLYDVEDAAGFQTNLAQHHIWSRVFPYSSRWLRLGLPGPNNWDRLERALT